LTRDNAVHHHGAHETHEGSMATA